MDSAKLLSLTRELMDLEAEKKSFNADTNGRIKKLKEDIAETVKE